MRICPPIFSKRIIFIIVFASMLMMTCSVITKESNSSFSQSPPGFLEIAQVPQFIAFGFDDNGFSGLDNSGGTGGVKFIINLFASRYNPSGAGNRHTYDGAQIHFSMYCTTSYLDRVETENPVFIKRVWKETLLKEMKLEYILINTSMEFNSVFRIGNRKFRNVLIG